MSFLDELTNEQRESLVSLPYRVGLMISQSDITGGDDARQKELQALSNIINGFAAETFGSETIQYIMNETVEKQDCWEKWAENTDQVLADCEQAINIVATHGEEKDITAFQNHMLEIAEAVALAFREYEHLDSFAAKLSLYLSYYQGLVKARLAKEPYRSLNEYLSISACERKALNTVAAALGTTYL